MGIGGGAPGSILRGFEGVVVLVGRGDGGVAPAGHLGKVGAQDGRSHSDKAGQKKLRKILE